jgi:hypothetical protein
MDLTDSLNTVIAFLPGWLQQTFMVMGALRVLAKPFSATVQSIFDKAVAAAVESSSEGDDHFLAKVLSHPIYRVSAWLLDCVASVKLPTYDALMKALAK